MGQARASDPRKRGGVSVGLLTHIQRLGVFSVLVLCSISPGSFADEKEPQGAADTISKEDLPRRFLIRRHLHFPIISMNLYLR